MTSFGALRGVEAGFWRVEGRDVELWAAAQSRVGGDELEVLGAPVSSILCRLAGRATAESVPLTSLTFSAWSAVVVALVCGRCVLRFAESRSRQRPPLKTGFDRSISSPIEKLTSIPSSAISIVHEAPETTVSTDDWDFGSLQRGRAPAAETKYFSWRFSRK